MPTAKAPAAECNIHLTAWQRILKRIEYRLHRNSLTRRPSGFRVAGSENHLPGSTSAAWCGNLSSYERCTAFDRYGKTISRSLRAAYLADYAGSEEELKMGRANPDEHFSAPAASSSCWIGASARGT